jgi:hypothetical protein
MRQYTGNRIGLAIVGGTLLSLGTYAWLRGQDRFFGLPPKAKVLPGQVTRALAGEAWPLWGVALVLLVLSLCALRWLLLCLGWGRRGARDGTATAMLHVGLKNVEGLSGAMVRVGSDGVRIALACPAAADMGSVVSKMDQDIVGKIRNQVGDDETPALVRLHVRR